MTNPFKSKGLRLGVAIGALVSLVSIFNPSGSVSGIQKAATAAISTLAAPSPTAVPTNAVVSKLAANQAMPVSATLDDPGPGNCVPGLSILRNLRQGGGYHSPYTQPEIDNLKQTWVQWVSQNQSASCVQAMAASLGLTTSSLVDWLTNQATLRELTVPMVIQNTFFDSSGKLQNWQVQTLPRGELVWFKPDGSPWFKFVCGNVLSLVSTPSPTVVPQPTTCVCIPQTPTPCTCATPSPPPSPCVCATPPPAHCTCTSPSPPPSCNCITPIGVQQQPVSGSPPPTPIGAPPTQPPPPPSPTSSPPSGNGNIGNPGGGTTNPSPIPDPFP